MPSELLDDKAIFNVARNIDSPSARAEYLRQVCGANRGLLEQVETLLRAYEEQESFLESPPGSRRTISQPVLEKPGSQIGPYKLLQEIGQGGMGVVYLAEQTEPVRRKVALKIIKPGMDTRQVIARFEAERQALSLMDHPNIAKVLDAGTTDSGQPYFVMELVKGQPITQYCDEQHLTPRERLELLLPVCQAIQHAHQKGIIHRDIKPTNILVTEYDHQPVPKVIDFGVAKATSQALTERTMFTGFGQIVGTLEYMSPEQAKVNQLDIDTRSDIYSLGVLLYELLTGSTPFDRKRLQSAAFDEMLRIIREEEPPKPSTRLSDSHNSLPSISAQRHTEPAKLTRLVRGELDWIVMKALEKDRSRRYETANGFGMDIQRYLDDEPVQACPPSAGYRLRKFARRNKVGLVMTSVVLSALILAIIGLTVSNVLVRAERNEKTRALGQKEKALREKGQALREKQAALAQARTNYAASKKQQAIARANEREARKQERLAKAQELLASRRFYAAQMNLAMQAWEAGDIARVLVLLESQRPKPGEKDLRAFEWYYLWQLSHQGRRLTLRGHKGGVKSLAFLRDGTMLASCGGGELRLWDSASGMQQKTVLSGVGCTAISPDGKILAAGGQQTTLYDVATMTKLSELATGSVQSLAISPDGSTLATGLQSGVVMLWEVGTGRNTFTLSAHSAQVLAVKFSLDGRTLATASGWGDGVTKLWDLADDPPRVTHQLRRAKDGLAFLPDGKTLLIAGWGSAGFYDVGSGQLSQEVALAPSYNWVSAALSPDGKTFAFGLEERTVKLWDRTQGHLRTYGHLKEVGCVAFSPDGKVVAAGTNDGVVHLWDANPEPEPTLPSAVGFTCAAFSSDRKTLALGTNDGKVKLWDTLMGQERALLSAHSSPVRSLAFSTDGKALASASGAFTETGGKGEVKVWDPVRGREIATLDGHTGSVCSVAFSPDGHTVASGSFDGTAKLWDVATREARLTLTGRRVTTVAFSPNGKTLATGGQFGVTLWDTASGQKQASWAPSGAEGGAYVFSLAFSPDGKLLATGGSAGTGTITLWDAATGQLRASLKGHTTAVYSVAFSSDGGTLGSTSRDGSMRLWDVATGQERISLKWPEGGQLPFITFATDDSSLVMGSPDGTARILRAATDSEAVSPRRPFDFDDPDDPWVLRLAGHRLWTTGHFEEAEKVFRKAAAALEKLAEAAPETSDYQNALPGMWFRLGLVLMQTGKIADAELAFSRAQKHQHKLPGDVQESLARSEYIPLGNMLLTAGQTELAARAYEQAAELRPDDLEMLLLLASPALRRGDWQAAIALYDRAIQQRPENAELKICRDRYAGLADRSPDSLEYQSGVAGIHEELANLFTRAGRPKEAEAARNDQVAVLEKLLKEVAPVRENRVTLAWLHNGLGWILRNHFQGRELQAEEEHRAALAVLEQEVTESPAGYSYETERSEILYAIATLMCERGDQAGARPLVDRATALAKSAFQVDRHDDAYFERLCRDFRTYASFFVRLGDHAAAEQTMRQAVARWEERVAESPPGSGYRKEVAQRFAELIELLLQQGKSAEATELAVTLGAAHYRAGNWKESVAAIEKSAEPSDKGGLFYLAMAHWHLGNIEDARKWYDQGVVWMEKYDPKNEKLRRVQAEAEELLAAKRRTQ